MGHFPGRLPVLKVKRELRVLALPPHEVLSQLQFCRADVGTTADLAYLWLSERLSQSSKRVGPMRGLSPGVRD